MNNDTTNSQKNGDLVKLLDGSYLFVSSDGKFDIDRFNRNYDQYKIRRKQEMDKKIQQKLAIYNKPKPELPIYKNNIATIMINMKDELFDTLDDLLQGYFNLSTFTKNNRLFYIGILLIIISIFIFAYMQAIS